MRRITTFILALLLAITALAQSPEAVLEAIRNYPNLAYPVASTYPSIPLEEIEKAPEGFTPFYFSLTGRHGSRYETKERHFRKAVDIFSKGKEQGILTADGELLLEKMSEVLKAQHGNDGELSAVGFEQWNGIGERAYKNFGEVFESGTSIEAKSSTSMRCVLSMVSFTSAIKGKVPSITIKQNSRKSELGLLRPLADDPSYPEAVKEVITDYRHNGEWIKARNEWAKQCDMSTFLSKVTTDAEALRKCSETRHFSIARYAFITLIFGENFGINNRDLITRLFTPEELYNLYVYQTVFWVSGSVGRGNDYSETNQSYMRPLVEDILNKAQEAIDGKNANVANLRFTHDTYMSPLLSVIGYEGCVPKWSDNVESATTSFNHGKYVPMASNLQLILYRNKQGKVFVRSLINERDAYLPIACKSAPFYPWKDFCNHIEKNLKELDKAKERVVSKHKIALE